jgi:hypothetical protein
VSDTTSRLGDGGPELKGSLRVAAIACVAVHLVAMGLSASLMTPGTPLAPADDRVAWLAARPLGWSVGWAAWALSAFTLVFFLAAVAWRTDAPLARLGVVLAAAGSAVDILCDTCQVVLVPAIAAQDRALFPIVEHAVWAGGLVPANCFYSLGCLLATLACAGRVPRRTTALGAATFAGGMAMLAAGFTLHPTHMQVSSGATMVFFVAWVVDLSRGLRAAQ